MSIFRRTHIPPGHEVKLVMTNDGYKEVFVPVDESAPIADKGRLRKLLCDRRFELGGAFEYAPPLTHHYVLTQVYADQVAKMGELYSGVNRPGRNVLLTNIEEA